VAPDLTPRKVLAVLICLLPLSLAPDDLRDLLVFFNIFVQPFFCRFSALARCHSGESSRELFLSSAAAIGCP
jgi:hypothetical protein